MDKVKVFTFSVGFSVTLILYLANTVSGRDCLIDEKIGWFQPDNVYQCQNDQKCCIESAKASCCSNKGLTDETLDQIKLWGTVFGVTLVIAILVCCCRKDNNCCDGDATCCYYLTCRCLCGRKKSDDIEYQKFPPPSPTISTASSKKDHPLKNDAPKSLQVDGHCNKTALPTTPAAMPPSANHLTAPPGSLPQKSPGHPTSPPLIQVD